MQIDFFLTGLCNVRVDRHAKLRMPRNIRKYTNCFRLRLKNMEKTLTVKKSPYSVNNYSTKK